MSSTKEELFQIGADAIRAVSNEEALATIQDLKEMDLFHLPFTSVSIRAPVYDLISVVGPDGKPFTGQFGEYHFKDGKSVPPLDESILLTNVTLDPAIEPTVYFVWPDGQTRVTKSLWEKGDKPSKGFENFLGDIRENLTELLILLLATRNAVKTRQVNKLAKLGIGKKNIAKSFIYTTHISVPRPEDLENTAGSNPTGAHRRPHLRRGHIRRQHYGPHNQFLKKVWIQPVFVNADEEFISSRTAYNLSTQFPPKDSKL